MKKNLLFPSIYFSSKQTFIAVFCFISSSVFSQNPLLLKSPFPGGSGRSIQQIVATQNGKTFFNTIDNNNHFSNLWGLWTTDGTQQGTNKITLTSPPVPGGSNSFISTEATLLTQLGNDKIIFAGDNESGYGEVWVSDGTQAGTFVLEQFLGSTTQGPPVSNIATFGSSVIYSVITNDNKLQIHKTDGTYAGTTLVYDFGDYTKYSVSYFKAIGNILYFELNNNTTTHNEIWRTDGTTAGTYQVKDLGKDYGFASEFMSFKNNIYFVTVSSTYGDYLWKSDGTNGGTALLKQISNSFNSDNLFPSYAAVENNLILANNLLYFAANDGTHGKELWKTDGTAAGTAMTFDFYQGATGSNPQWLTVLNDQLYFSATSSFFPGTDLYSYNGSQFSQPIQQNNLSNPTNLIAANNTILFGGIRNANDGNELWFSGGSTPNTLEIANINPMTNASSNPSLISVSGNNVYFAANYDANGDGIDDPCIFKYAFPQKIWTGAVNSDVSAIDNWFPTGGPANKDNVLVPVNAPNSISHPFLFCNDLTNNGTIYINGGLILITGNLFNSGFVSNPSPDGTYYPGVFGITSNTTPYHTFGNTGILDGQLTLSSGINLHLTSTAYIPALRAEGGGYDSIFLGAYSLKTDKFNLYTPTIILDSGLLTMLVGNNPVTFPVAAGAGSFTPVTITNTGAQDYFSVGVKNGVFKDGYSGDIVTQQAVNKTWNIEEQTSGGSNATITLQWNADDELPGFDRSHVYLNHYTNGAWDSGTPGIAAGSGPYTFTRNGFTSFSPFSISSSTSALPVNLISFSANKTNNTVQLNWQTATEINISFYAIERSPDGNSFSSIGNVNASDNSSITKNYSYTDQQPLTGANFYRLKMVDVDGKFTYSRVVAIKMDSKNNTLQIFPNPAKNILNIQINGINEKAILQILDMTGRKIKEEKISLNGTTSFPVDISNLPKGTYNLWLKGNSINEQKKFMKE